ncbi:hypothetical protein FLA_0860 [Filimonas lacunae]|nr:hypothetical protein FLA_0860 [Filimonas lacunae]
MSIQKLRQRHQFVALYQNKRARKHLFKHCKNEIAIIHYIT